MSKYDDKIAAIVRKAKTISTKIREINKSYILSLSDRDHWLLIPSEEKGYISWNDYLTKLRGNLKVIGGEGLERTESLFGGVVLENIDFSEFDTSQVTNMNHMFYWCSIDILDLGSFDTSKVTDMSCMFNYCKTNSLDLRNFDTSQVTNMSRMFADCKAKSIDLSSFDTSQVTDMSDMFKGCESKVIASDKRILEELNNE